MSATQNAFVEGKQILDATLIANEAIDSMLRRKESRLLCKLDIKNAYDHVGWDFFPLVMDKMGFGRNWINWVSGASPQRPFL